MSAGSKLVELRAVLRRLLPYVQHRPGCAGACQCDLERVLVTARKLANLDVKHPGKYP